jgi:RNA polymerase sporulation-specific sigma factor
MMRQERLKPFFLELAKDKYAPLPREEEVRFASIVRASGSFDPVPREVTYARMRLTESNLRFVVRVASDLAQRNRDLDIEEAVANGYTGLIHAIELFDPMRNVKLISFAVAWIKETILSAVKQDRKYKDCCDSAIDCREEERKNPRLCNSDEKLVDGIVAKDLLEKIIIAQHNVLTTEEILILSLYYKVNSPFKEPLPPQQISIMLNKNAATINNIRLKALKKIKSIAKSL